MYNDIFSIGPITVHGYGLMIAIGLIAGLLTGEAKAKKRGMSPDEVYYLTFLCTFTGFLSAKILFCIVEWKAFFAAPLSVLKMNGFVVYGGIIGGILAAYIWCRARKLIFLDYFDVVLPSVAVVQGFGRLGCFLAGCCYGRETDSVFGIVFKNSDFAPNNVKLIPTQLISSAGMFLIAGLLFWYARKPRKRGSVGFLYLILYSVGRFFVEFLRNDHRGVVGALSTSQFISIFILLVGACGFLLAARRGDWGPAPMKKGDARISGSDGQAEAEKAPQEVSETEPETEKEPQKISDAEAPDEKTQETETEHE